MKALWTILLTSLIVSQVSAQKISEKEVPENVKNQVLQNYGVTDIDWTREGENYEATFEQNGGEVSVVTSADGSILEIEKEIEKNELPKGILEALKKDYSGFKLEEIARIDSKGIISYETEVKKGKEKFELTFDANGHLLAKTMNENDETN